MPHLVGLTGGIATGKSSAAEFFQELGAAVVDADQAARAVVAPGMPALDALVQAFGPGILTPQGTLDRSAMRTRIAQDPQARTTLEQITHPAIRLWVAERVQAHAQAGATVIVVEAALLVETGGYRMYPTLVVVSCSPETQLRRLMARDGMTEDQARQLIATQLSMDAKEAVATYVLRNDGSPDDLRAAVRAVWDRLGTSPDQ